MKKKIFFVIVVILLVTALLFCLIYTWPRTLDSLIGDREPAYLLIACTNQMNFQSSQLKNETWELSDEQEHDPAVLAEVTKRVGQIKYRFSLRSLFSPSIIQGDYSSTIRSNTTIAILYDEDAIVTVDHLGIAAGIRYPDKKGFIVANVVNEDALAALSDYIKETAAEHRIS